MNALTHLGYKYAYSYIKISCVKTDAPIKVVYELAR